MRAFCAFAAFAFLCGCVESEPERPILEAPASIEDDAATKARLWRENSNTPSVTRTFLINWENHFGFTFSSPNEEAVIIWPDFADRNDLNKIDIFTGPKAYPRGQKHPNEGKLLICYCTGV